MAARRLPSPFSPATAAFLLAILLPPFSVHGDTTAHCAPINAASDRDQIQFALNLEFLEAELFLHAALGHGLDEIAPEYALGGPPPVGAQKAQLGPIVWRIVEEFGFQEIGHLRAIFETVGGVPRPLYDLSARNFGAIFDEAVGGYFGGKLEPPFNPYLCETNFLLACYLIPYVGLNGYVGTIPNLAKYTSRRLVAGLLGAEAGQDAVFRTLLYERAQEQVQPYNNITVADFTAALSELRNRLGMCGLKDEGLWVPPELGAENRTESNVLSLDFSSLAYARTPPEVLRIVYGTGDEHRPGGFLPRGGNGKIAMDLLGDGKC
ncbi:unnamed protein product [Linum tenue]|uniref:Desiccation-related protein PCC13-62 n=1 Tax=Linum tenue TaxID=586396 RepID=A0AAV0IDP6_9ROSI|nr:unnamed protein product [Linum tenue]